uniref:ANF_receptor domain-containing protein n=1 Tax=Heligmosomoides polygyrus TaxID=6339 RepID=A0A183GGP0_HELPZ
LSTSSVLDSLIRFPTTAVLSVNSFSLGVAVKTILLSFDWNQFAFIFSTIGDKELTCSSVKNDMQSVINQYDSITLNYVGQLFQFTSEGIASIMETVSERARIIPMLGDKELMVWQDPHTPSDGRDEEAKEAFSWVMAITDLITTGRSLFFSTWVLVRVIRDIKNSATQSSSE